tara:strand:+ start:1873 stop:2613 length:741 start_codon:yes stop_codon:yes gene_type:complete
MKVVAIIPARLKSSRLPGKPLIKINKKTMIEHCFHLANKSEIINKTIVATCDKKINNFLKSVNIPYITTSINHKRATTRTSEALKKIEKKLNTQFDIIIMVQGDHPYVSRNIFNRILKEFNDKKVQIVNVASIINKPKDINDKNNVKVITNNLNDAIYFSREPIPSKWNNKEKIDYLMQTGIIAFRKNQLAKFNSSSPTRLEKIESIDMNRLIENSKKIRILKTKQFIIGVDTYSDVIRVRKLIKK